MRHVMLIAACVVLAASFVYRNAGPGASLELVKLVESQSELDELAKAPDSVVLVDFYLDTCPPCRKLAPIIDSLSRRYEGRVVFVRVDAGDSRDMAAKYEVTAVPTIILYSSGAVVRRWVGLHSTQEYQSALDEALADTPNERKRS